jgi:hypothetical protein
MVAYSLFQNNGGIFSVQFCLFKLLTIFFFLSVKLLLFELRVLINLHLLSFDFAPPIET